ncbi:MAG: ATP-binding protein, partial [Candidatus Krumholzibacteriia bacterium]
VKAAYGGGGKGMRLVSDPAELPAAAAAAAREARQAFGNGAIYLERWLERPRHVEFQIFGDRQGHVVQLGERECSIQRRHQKIVEETPSPALTPDLRERMAAAAVAAARAAGYVNAGTVEFLVDAAGGFHFLEMNTRLQVEHPITEWVTGLDLVRAQLQVAAGAPLPWRQEEIVPRGHAIECRLCAEDPAHGFRPSLGRILLLDEPAGPGVRVDSGVAAGDEVTMHYDPLLAKLSVHGPDRAAAIARGLAALRDYAVLGIATNGAYLQAILDHPEFRAGRTHTGFLAANLADWTPDGGSDERDALVAAAVHACLAATRGGAAGVAGAAGRCPDDGPAAVAAPVSPWARLGRFRLRGLA